MNRELQQALERVGYDSLYERYIPHLGPRSARGERIARSPFPDVVDNHPSFSVNVYSGLWHCMKTDRGGNYVQFVALMEATEFDPETGLAIPDFGAVERRLLRELGVVNPVDPQWVINCREHLAHDLIAQTRILDAKPWDLRVLYQLGVGYDQGTDRFTIPVFARDGELVNCRLYAPGRDPKFLWAVANYAGNFLTPAQGWREQVVILVEGETDAITLRSHGFAAVSGNMGASCMVPEGHWWRDKIIYVWGDDSAKGREAVEVAVELLRRDARMVRRIVVPDWPGKQELRDPDPSDFIKYLISQGYEFEQRQRAIVNLLNESVEVEHPHAVFDAPALRVSFAQALQSGHLNRRISFPARVTARSDRTYILPVRYNITCPAGTHPFCRRCPMANEFHGNGRFHHDPRSPNTLRLVQETQEGQMKALKEIHGIVRQCPDPTLVTHQAVNVEPVIINSSSVDVEGQTPGDQERMRREAMVIVPPGQKLEENRDYILEGLLYPAPKTQHGLVIVDRFTPSVAAYEQFEMTQALYRDLQIFQPRDNEDVFSKLVDVARDLSDSTTLIRDRLDLHLAYRTVWHSSLAFRLAGTLVERGWIEALVIGDTRCGKSVTFRRLAEFYGLGLLVDCKMQSPAGILGSVVMSPTTGERYVVAGLLPQQDERIICFDEFHVPRWAGRQGLIDVLSSTRSEGIVRISKAASAQFRARVRSIWLGNPGLGRLMSELGISGIEVIPRLIQQPEDIARFDFALAVAQEDVSPDLLNQVHTPQVPRYPRALSQSLLAWTYSRTVDQIVFTDDAQHTVMHVSKLMYERYDASIPLVEPADQRVRVAKVAASIAAQCFSTDSVGQHVVVTPAHVAAAYQLFTLFYDKPAMGYAAYSDRVTAERTLRDEHEVRRIFDETFHPRGRAIAEELLRLDEFTERTFGTMVPVQVILAKSALQALYANRCLRIVQHGRREAFELTPAFVYFLKRYLRGE